MGRVAQLVGRIAGCVALVGSMGAAWGHDADIVFVRLAPGSATGAERPVREVMTLTAATLQLLAPVDEDGDGLLTQAELEARASSVEAGVWAQAPLKAGESRCTRQSSKAWVRETFVELSAELSCGAGPLSQTFRFLSVLPPSYSVVLGRFGARSQAFAQGVNQTLEFPEAQAAEAQAPGLGGWVRLGVFHIFTGWDHLAFLFALLLVGGTVRRTLLLVTSFTVAHSLTLAATALGWVELTEAAARWVEAAIAASIIFVAAENLLLRQHRHRAAITFLFGLVHGFGFASVLRSYGLGDSAVSALFGFNLGVEVGQAVLVLVLFPLMKQLARRPVVSQWTVRVGSVVLLFAGGYWLTERVLG